jgi:hypothetical protein
MKRVMWSRENSPRREQNPRFDVRRGSSALNLEPQTRKQQPDK